MKRLAACMAALALSNTAHAIVTYTYRGNHFTEFHSDSDPRSIHPTVVFTRSDSVLVEVVLSGEIPARSSFGFDTSMEPIFNSSFGNSPITPLSWKISAGPVSFAGAAGADIPARTFASFSLVTDTTGAIALWDVEVTGFLEDLLADGTLFRGADSFIWTGSSVRGFSADGAISCLGDVACLQSFGYPTGSTGGWNPASAGTWNVSVSAVPEPAPSALLAVGFLTVGLASVQARRRLERQS